MKWVDGSDSEAGIAKRFTKFLEECKEKAEPGKLIRVFAGYYLTKLADGNCLFIECANLVCWRDHPYWKKWVIKMENGELICSANTLWEAHYYVRSWQTINFAESVSRSFSKAR